MVMMMVTIQPNCSNITPVILYHGKRKENRYKGKGRGDYRNRYLTGAVMVHFWATASFDVVVMFSNTTIASSTTIPMATERELRDNVERAIGKS